MMTSCHLDPGGTNLSEIRIRIQKLFVNKMNLKMSVKVSLTLLSAILSRPQRVSIPSLFKQWFVTFLEPNHYLNQCKHVLNGTPMNKLNCRLNQNANIFFQEMLMKRLSKTMDIF